MLSYSQELSTGIQRQVPTSQPATTINKFNGKLTREGTFSTKTRVSNPPDLEHPYSQSSEKENGPFAHQKTRLTKGESVVSRCFCPKLPLQLSHKLRIGLGSLGLGLNPILNAIHDRPSTPQCLGKSMTYCTATGSPSGLRLPCP